MSLSWFRLQLDGQTGGNAALISDTHVPPTPGLPSQLIEHLHTVDLILHAGDVTAPSVLHWCEQFAPLFVARGNNDLGWDDARVEDVQWLDVEGFRLAMVHDMEPETRPIIPRGNRRGRCGSCRFQRRLSRPALRRRRLCQ